MNKAHLPEPWSVTILSEHAERYRQLIEQADLNSLAITCATSSARDINPDKVIVLLADPDLAAQIIPHCNNLLWCQSTWAGNSPLLNQPKQDYRLTGIKGVFGEQMREYVFAYLLHFTRNVAAFTAVQTGEASSRWNPPKVAMLGGKTLGIIGAGSIAQALVPAAQLFGLRLTGLTRQGEPLAGFDRMYTPQEKCAFANECDFLVNLLPDTAATSNMIDATLLASLPAHCVLINAGRGSAIDDEALLLALNENRLKAAVLDVFRQEPLPDDHPFWQHPKIHITQHTAAKSYPEDIAAIFIDNASRFLRHAPLRYEFDFIQGY